LWSDISFSLCDHARLDLVTDVQTATEQISSDFRTVPEPAPMAEPWANTSTAIGKWMLTVLSGVAEFERD
jgi:hypothetical protein